MDSCHKTQDLCLLPKTQVKKLVMVTHNLSTREADTGGSLGLTGMGIPGQ